MAWVTKTLSLQTAGVELPRSGSGVFQRTFSVRLQLVGRSFSVQVPCPSAPRQPGQLAALAEKQAAKATDIAANGTAWNFTGRTVAVPRKRDKPGQTNLKCFALFSPRAFFPLTLTLSPN